LTGCCSALRARASDFRLRASAGPVRLVIGLVALGGLAFGLAHVSRLPGALGETVRGNLAADREATALFYTEVDGWEDWRSRR
jgi:hypothetical protein